MEKKDVKESIEELLRSLDNLPTHAMIQPISHYDYYSLLLLMRALLELSCKEEI